MKTQNTSSIGDKIKIIADSKDITMYKIAKESGISNSYLSDLVNNVKTNPSVDVVKRIAKVLDVPVTKLIS